MSDSSFPTLRIFKCPSCGASLQAPDEGTTTVCQYCNNTVVVPEEMRPRQAFPQVTITTGTVDARTAEALRTAAVVTGGATAAGAGCSVLGAVIAVAVAILAVGLGVFLMIPAGSSGGPGPIGVPAILASPTPAFAAVTLEFGGKGAGAGKFEDARYIAVDGDGNVFVAEYGAPRIAKFDQAGKFLMQIDIPGDPKRHTGGMVADYAGHLWVTYDEKLLEFDAATGKVLKTIEDKFPAPGYEALAVDSSNHLYSVPFAQDTLTVLDGDGQRLDTYEQLVANVDDNLSTGDLQIAVSGRGTLYVTGVFMYEVLVFDSNGKFKDRFGSKGDGPGQFTSTGALAVDGRGRLFVEDFGGIQVFTASGDFVNRIDWDYTRGSIMGLTIDRQDNLWVVTNQGKVFKLEPYDRGR
jgi:DNA-directed RNA polymerase subunit RPC12/RpoP